MEQAEQDPNLLRSASNVLGKVHLTFIKQSGGASGSAGGTSQF